MAQAQLRSVIRQLYQVAGKSATGELSDRQLLERFVAGHEEAAFATLVRRHGPLVLGVCWRRLHDWHEAEDAFQATFLLLARKAGRIRWGESVGNWLYEVASRVAAKARANAARRRAHEQKAGTEARLIGEAGFLSANGDAAWRELCAVLDEELNRLSERYRAPLLLCYLEGETQDQAARRLGWSVRTLKRRLAHGRELLRLRLTRRGMTLPAALLAAGLSQSGASAVVPVALGRATVKAALLTATGKTAAGIVSANVATLADAAGKSLALLKMKTAALLLTGLCVLGAGAGVVAQRASTTKSPEAQSAEQSKAPAKAPEPANKERPKPEESTKPHADQYGDPLPKEALARLGTSRLRTVRYTRFAPDGRRIVLDRADGDLQIFEVPTGKPLAVLRATDVPGRKDIIGSTLAFTADGKYLAAVCWEGRCGIWDTATGRLVRWLESGPFYSILKCEFSPDGKLLAVGAGAPQGKIEGIEIGVYEVATGRRLIMTPGTNAVFAQDGRSLVTWPGYIQNSEQTARRVAVPTGKELTTFSYHERFYDFAPHSDGTWFFEVAADRSVRARDAATGELKHSFRGVGGNNEEPVYVRHVSGRRELIAVVGTRPGRIWCWDLDTGKPLWDARLAAPAYRVDLSADGRTLVTGDTAGLVQVWDAASGKERVSFRPGTIGHGTSVIISADGKMIATTSDGIHSKAVAFWDASTGKLLSALPGHASGITSAAFAPNGATVYTIGKDRTLRTWETKTGQEVSRAIVDAASHLAVSADGKTLFIAGPERGTIRVLDPRTGRAEREISAFTNAVVGLALTASGKRLIAAGRDGGTDADLLRVFDAGTGAKLSEFGHSKAKIEQLAASAESGAVATTYVGQRVVLWDAAGKRLLEQAGQGRRTSAGIQGETPYRIGSIAVSADGRWLAYSDQEQGIVIVDVRIGHEIGRAKPDVYYQVPSARDELRDVLAFSPDGQTVAWSGVESTADVFLIEVRTAQVRRRLSGDSSPVQNLAFSPGGSTLLSAGPDGSALIWNVMSQKQRQSEMATDELSRQWLALAGSDASKAYGAIQSLVASRGQAVLLLRERLRPFPRADQQRVARLLGDLDSDQFAVREKAANELEKLGELAAPALRKALEGQPSLEFRRRADILLAKLAGPITVPEQLRALRAVEVLEHICTPDAQAVLKELAKGAPEARMTQEAKAALDRLSRRNAPSN